jgi:hypothetical protein
MKQKVIYPVGASRPAELPPEPTFGIGVRPPYVCEIPYPQQLPLDLSEQDTRGFVNAVRELAFQMYMNEYGDRHEVSHRRRGSSFPP